MSSEDYMRHCLELAERGAGFVAPNPMVGSVIVASDKVIGSGYHTHYGAAHAEVNAIASVEDKALLKNATLYVNLEPCSHHGKTPPCADLIIASNIPRVVIGTKDPNPRVSGEGMKKLENAGLEVTSGVLKKECQHLNRRFLTYYEKERPYVILKWAETADGFVAREDFSSKWISSEESRKLAHSWRAQESAILIGTNTAIFDNPELTVRLAEGKNPVRIFLDREGRVPASHHLYDGSAPTILFSNNGSETPDSVTTLPFPKDIGDLLSALHEQKILSVLVEGGSKLLQSFIDSGLWDEARVFTAKKSFDAGIPAPALSGADQTEQLNSGEDVLTFFKRRA